MCVWYWLPASGYYGCSSPETASPVTQILASSQSPSLFTVSVNEFAHCLFTIGAHQLRRHDNSRSWNGGTGTCSATIGVIFEAKDGKYKA